MSFQYQDDMEPMIVRLVEQAIHERGEVCERTTVVSGGRSFDVPKRDMAADLTTIFDELLSCIGSMRAINLARWRSYQKGADDESRRRTQEG